MARFAVLGANSFSGAAFVAHAAREGHEVIPLRRPWHDLNSGLERIFAAVDDFRPEYFVNFAALNMVGESWKYYDDYYRTNVLGVARLAAGLRVLRRFVQVSTPEVYGSTETFLKEGAPFNPSTPYAISRAAADLHLLALHRVYSFPVAFTRTVNVYGPGQQPYRLIPKTVLKILRGERLKLHGGGVSTRAFIHIEDVAEAILAVALGGEAGETYHVATGEQRRIRDVVRAVCGLMGARFEDVTEDDLELPGKDMAYQLDDAKIRGALGWTPHIEFDRGLADTVAWFREHAATYEGKSLEYEHRP